MKKLIFALVALLSTNALAQQYGVTNYKINGQAVASQCDQHSIHHPGSRDPGRHKSISRSPVNREFTAKGAKDAKPAKESEWRNDTNETMT